MLLLRNKIFLISLVFISLYFFLVFWLLFHKQNHLLYPSRQCSTFFTYKGLYNINQAHLKQDDILTAVEKHNINFLILANNKKINTPKSKQRSLYQNHILIIPTILKEHITSIVDLNKIWSDKFQYNKIHILWTLLTYPFAPQTAFLYLLQHSQSIAQQSAFLNSTKTTLASFNVKPNNFLKSFQIPSYNQLFHLVKNYIFTTSELTGHTQSDTQTIKQAIAKSQSFVGFDFLGNTQNFCTYIQVKKKEKTINKPVGSKLYLSKYKQISLYIQLPYKPQFPYQVKIYKNKQLFLTYSKLIKYIPLKDEANYKVLVEVKPPLPKPFKTHWTPWIITNSFFVKK